MSDTSRRLPGGGRFRSTGVVRCLALGLALVVAGTAGAVSVRDPSRAPEVIQNRAYQMASELTLQVGTIPIDAFYKGVTGTLRYTLHFNHAHAWEILGVGYSYNFGTRLRKALTGEFAADPRDYVFREAVLIAESNYVLKPFYGKMANFNRFIVRSEFYLNAGPAFMLYATDSTGFDGLSYRPGLNYGIGIRVFSAEWFSVRIDLRHYIVMAADALGSSDSEEALEIDNLLYLGLGGSFNVGYD